MSGEYLTVRQVADLFGVSPRTVRRWIRQKLLGAKRHRVTEQVYVPREEIERRKGDLEDWQPGLKPVTIKGAQPDGDASTREESMETDTMPKGEKKEQQAQEQQGEQSAAKQQRAPPAKKSSWGTVLDDEDEEE